MLRCKISQEGVFEICGSKCIISGRTINMISLYRPSNQESNSKLPTFFIILEDLLENIRRGDDLIVAGDLNINLLDKTNSNSCHLINIFTSFNLNLLYTDHITRRSNGENGSLIDHVFSNLCDGASYKILENNGGHSKEARPGKWPWPPAWP
jgi:exonuclease III